MKVIPCNAAEARRLTEQGFVPREHDWQRESRYLLECECCWGTEYSWVDKLENNKFRLTIEPSECGDEIFLTLDALLARLPAA